MVQLVFGIELLTVYSLPEVGSEQKVCYWGFNKTHNEFWALKKSPK